MGMSNGINGIDGFAYFGQEYGGPAAYGQGVGLGYGDFAPDDLFDDPIPRPRATLPALQAGAPRPTQTPVATPRLPAAAGQVRPAGQPAPQHPAPAQLGNHPDEYQSGMRYIGVFLLALSFICMAGYTYTQTRNVTILAGLAGAGLGATVCVATWRATAPAPNGQASAGRELTPAERPDMAFRNPIARTIAQFVTVAGLAALIGVGTYYLHDWQPEAGAVVCGLPAGFLVALYAPRLIRWVVVECVRDYYQGY